MKIFDQFTGSDEDKLTPREELANLRSFILSKENNLLFARLTDTLNVLQNRAQMMLSLITITLTISGFSGPQIARSSTIASISIMAGITFVLLSAIVLLAGPLRLTWVTKIRYENDDQVLLRLIIMRNTRTKRFYLASVLLVIGLVSYVSSVVAYLFIGAPK